MADSGIPPPSEHDPSEHDPSEDDRSGREPSEQDATGREPAGPAGPGDEAAAPSTGADRLADRAQGPPDLPDWTAIGRGLVGACPRCGGRGIFASMVDLREHCPTCGMHFEREHGYWLGAMAVITGVFLLVFAVVSVGGILVFWPDVPWVGLTVAGIVVNGAIPVLGYGWAKTAWMGIEQAFHPPSAAEEADAIARLASGPDPD